MQRLASFIKYSLLSTILSSCGSHYLSNPDFSDRTNINFSINQEAKDIGETDTNKNDPENTDTEKTDTLRIMTYNIAHGRGPVNVSRFPKSFGEFFYEYGLNSQMTKESMYLKLDQIAKLINNLNPDLVSLNEIDFNAYWSFEVDQLEYLSKKIGMKYYAYGTKWNPSLFFQAHCGNAVLSKYPLTGRNLPLNKTDSLTDTFIGEHSFMNIHIGGGKKINLVNTHLGGKNKKGQAEIIRDEVLDDLLEDTPAIITGDLNSEPGSRAIQVFLDTGYFHLFTGQDMPPTSNNTLAAIDHIIASTHFDYNGCVIPEVYYSDHKPVVCDLTIR